MKKLEPRKIEDLLKEHHLDEVLDGEVIEEISLDIIKPNPYQPRKNFKKEKINELADSIIAHGVFQPIIVKKVDDNYIIVSGERRFRASILANKKTIPAIVRQYQDKKMAEIALVENLQREDLNAIEEARAYLNLMQHLELTQNELSKKVGKSRSHITNLIGLLSLPEEVQYLVVNAKISMSHARSLSKLSDKEIIIKLANKIVSEDLSVRIIEELVKKENKNVKIKKNTSVSKYEDEIKLLKKVLGAEVLIKDDKITLSKLDSERVSKIIEVLKGIN